MIKEIAEKLDFPAEAIEYFSSCYIQISQNKEAFAMLCEARNRLFNSELQSKEYMDLWRLIAEKTGVLQDSVAMLFFLMCIKPLKEKYRECGLCEELLWETMQDLRYKLTECKNVRGHWGTFVSPWFHRFYLCERFAFGRLQYERVEFPTENYKDIVKRGDTVYCCHIPSSGTLLEADVLDSLKRAYNFFKGELKDGVLPVVCHSWLLYEPFKEVFSSCGNILKFRALFDVVENVKEPTNGDFWRVFNVEYSEEVLKSFAPKSRLQKNLREYLLAGNCMGFGLGVLLFDGEKVVKA